MSDDRGFLEADELLASGRLELVLTSGRKVLIRKIRRRELALIAKTIPDVTALATSRTGGPEAPPQNVDATEEMIHRIVAAAVLKPKLSLDPEAGPTPGDFDYAEQMEIFEKALEHSGFSKTKAAEVLPLSRTDS